MHQGVGYPSSSINICCWLGVTATMSAKLCLQRSRARYTNSPSSSMAKHLTTHACCTTQCHTRQRLQSISPHMHAAPHHATQVSVCRREWNLHVHAAPDHATQVSVCMLHHFMPRESAFANRTCICMLLQIMPRDSAFAIRRNETCT